MIILMMWNDNDDNDNENDNDNNDNDNEMILCIIGNEKILLMIM